MFAAQIIHYLTSFTPTSKALLKSCLGDANFDASDNAEVYNCDDEMVLPQIIILSNWFVRLVLLLMRLEIFLVKLETQRLYVIV